MNWRVLRVGLLILPLLALLGFAIYAATVAWNMDGDVQIDANAIVAMVLGIVFTLGLAGVLVWLLIYSERHGYDQ